ncbi:MAG TPA: hypothetical protein VKV16_07365, partial [Solirubrobacteraceae bacterium]|nr:hypothetical protein [Solirubrobacteraceae bacterium]
MRQHLRENALCLLMASAAAATVGWLGLYGFSWTDYEAEAKPAFTALLHGHVLAFLRLAPVYGGSLLERAPFALAAGAWGGGPLAVYRLVALPCLLAAIALAAWLCASMRRAGASRLARAVAVGLCVANPLVLPALEVGHPEELLGGVLCVAAVLAATRQRSLLAAVLLGLAIANKEWALLAVGPVLLALCAQRVRTLVLAALLAAALLAPFVLASAGGLRGELGASSHTGAIFQPWQLWWFFGAPNHVPASAENANHMQLAAALDTRPGYRIAPRWIEGLAHPLILALALPLTLLAWPRRRRAEAPLLLLALLLALRCALDPWDFAYYPIPFLLALLAWETTVFRRPPLLSLAASASLWTLFEWLPKHASPDVVSASFAAFAVLSILALGLRLYASRGEPRRRSTARID